MNFNHRIKTLIVTALWLGMEASHAAPVVVNFEAFSDLQSLTNQVSGLSFSNTTVLAAGASLNEINFPPKSGSKVVVDLGGPITINFASSISSVGAFFTYSTGLTFSVYDADANLLGLDSSDFLSNTATSGAIGSAPNEFLGFTHSGIRRVVIAGDVSGGSFTMDDLTFEPSTSVPEPGSLALALAGLIALSRRMQRN